MKIGYILTTFPCLTETFAVVEMDGLREIGFDISVFAAARDDGVSSTNQGVKVFYRPGRFSRESVAAIIRMLFRHPLGMVRLILLILRLLWLCPAEALSAAGNLHTIAYFAGQLERDEIGHIHSYFLSLPAVIGMALSVVTGRSFSISAHARDIFVEHGAVGLKARRARFIRVCSEHGLHHLKAMLPETCQDKLHAVRHGVRTASTRAGAAKKGESASDSDKTIIAVGRLVEKKGFADLLRAFALVLEERPDCRLMIVGDGPQQKHLKELARQLRLEDLVEFTGPHEPDVTRRLLGQATLLAAPSRIASDGDRDGIPNVILEAFACGVPVAASNIGGISEAVKDRHTGLLTEPGDIQGLASAIVELLGDEQLRGRLSQSALEVVKERFDSAKNARQLEELFFANRKMHRGPSKVVHIVEGFVGGTRTYFCNVLPALVKNGFDVTLVCSLNRSCPDSASRISELQTSGVKVNIIPMYREISPLRDIRSFITILRLLLRVKPDIVHTHCSKAGALGRVAAFLTRRRVIVHSPHCFAFLRCRGRSKKLVYLFLERMLGKLTTRLAAVSPSEANAAVGSHIVRPDRVVLISNGLSNGQPLGPNDYSAKGLCDKGLLGIDKDSSVVTTACRLVDYKGVFRFLDAAKASRAANTVFLLAGDGELKQAAQKFICENGLTGKVRLLGYVSNMDRLYAVSDLVVLCSDAEAQPYLLLEAMRAKCPVVATAAPGNTDLISHGRTGLLVEPSPAAIATAIDGLLADIEKRVEYAASAYAYFREHHSLEKQVAQLSRAYRDCMGNGDSDGPEDPK
jgi:glycosyltransferase involved in cell wall biosynthesis